MFSRRGGIHWAGAMWVGRTRISRRLSSLPKLLRHRRQRFPERALGIDGQHAGVRQRRTQAMHDRHHGTRRLARAGGPGDEKVAARLVAGPFEPPQPEDDGGPGLESGQQSTKG